VNSENSRRFAWQLGFLIVFWTASNFTMIIQYTHLPPEPLDIAKKMALERWGKPDPWTFHPWEYNPWNERETLVEALVIWLGLLYGLFRLINLWRIIRDDDQEEQWNEFWRLCETF
jgi:hypothetical protein